MFVPSMTVLALLFSQAACLPTATINDPTPASWNADGSLIGGGDKAGKSTELTILVSNPAAARVTNGLAVTTQPTSGTAGSNTHLTTCGPASSYPANSAWMNFADMFNKNKPSMSANGATDEEIGRIYNSINTIGTASLVDRRVILAVIMQESHGNPRVGSTTSHDGVGNPGLMQSHQGVTCFGQAAPCPQSIIDQMVRDGTQGTSSGDGLVQGINIYNGVYQALRYYNSGTVSTGNLCLGGATASYVADVASRLTGWVN